MGQMQMNLCEFKAVCVCLRAYMPGVRQLSLLRCLPCKHGNLVQPLEPMVEGGNQFLKTLLLLLVTRTHYGMCMCEQMHVQAHTYTHLCGIMPDILCCLLKVHMLQVWSPQQYSWKEQPSGRYFGLFDSLSHPHF